MYSCDMFVKPTKHPFAMLISVKGLRHLSECEDLLARLLYFAIESGDLYSERQIDFTMSLDYFGLIELSEEKEEGIFMAKLTDKALYFLYRYYKKE